MTEKLLPNAKASIRAFGTAYELAKDGDLEIVRKHIERLEECRRLGIQVSEDELMRWRAAESGVFAALRDKNWS